MQPNIVIILADTMRLDALPINTDRKRYSNISSLIKEAMVYDNVISPSSWTLPSHISIFTGQYPSEHGINEGNVKKFAEYPKMIGHLNERFITTKLRHKGYNTLLVSSNPFIGSDFSFGKYFDILVNSENKWLEASKAGKEKEYALLENVRDRYPGFTGSSIAIKILKDEGIIKGLNTLISLYNFRKFQRRTAAKYNYPIDKGYTFVKRMFENLALKEPFFIFINLMEMHEPYMGIDDKEIDAKTIQGVNVSPRIRKKIQALYYDQFAKIDEALGSIIYFLRSNHFLDNTLLIFTSDHGQSLFSHNYYTHGNFLYDELIRVPLVIRYEGGRKYPKLNKCSDMISLRSLYNLIYDHCEGNLESNINPEEKVFSETFGLHSKIASPPENYKWKRKSIFKNGWKLTLNDKGEVEEFFKFGENVSSECQVAEIKRSLVEEIEEFSGNGFFNSKTSSNEQ